MAIANVEFFSRVLGEVTEMTVILPETDDGVGVVVDYGNDCKLPTLWLYHGWRDNHNTWMRRTSIDRYVSGKNLAVVMPCVRRSLHSDIENSYAYFKFISEELPQIARYFFKLSDKREDNFVAGLSMGGRAAIKLGLLYPEQYSAVASLSGGLGFEHLKRFFDHDTVSREMIDSLKETDQTNYHILQDFLRAFGTMSSYLDSDDNLVRLLKRKVAEKVNLPAMHISIGKQDFLYEDNQLFRNELLSLGVSHTYMEEETAAHEWALWDKYIQSVIDWLPIKSN